MGANENADLVRRGYEAFSAADIAALAEIFADDAVWHLHGNGGLAGVKHGQEAIFGYFGELLTRSGGTFEVTLRDVVAGDEHTIGLHHDKAERDGKTLDHDVVLVVRCTGGRISEVWEYHADQANNDAFWS